jgi:hypothetical protein
MCVCPSILGAANNRRVPAAAPSTARSSPTRTSSCATTSRSSCPWPTLDPTRE